eukprot:68297-Pyramimonas_sp.AAC.1
MGFDLNDSFGWRRRKDGVIDWVRSQSLGPFARGEQRYAADQMLELCEKRAVTIASTSYNVGDTFFGAQSSSCIDYVAVFSWQMSAV